MKARWPKSCATFLYTFGLTFGAQADALDTWLVRASGTPQSLYAVTYGNGNFVAVGANGVMRSSTNGLNWVSRNSGQIGNMYGATFGNDVFVTAANGSSITNVAFSTNSADWLAPNPANYANFWGASYSGGVYFLVGSSSTIVTATNIDPDCVGSLTNCGWRLTKIAGSYSDLGGAAYGNGIYVIVGIGISLTSTNGIVWTNQLTNAQFYDVAFGNGIFVAVGSGGIWTSVNGVTWTFSLSTSQLLARIVFANGTFVAVGGFGTVLTSTNGISWKKRTVPTSSFLSGVTFGNGTFVATGANGAIIQSGSVAIPSLSAHKSAGGGVALTLTGQIGRSYRIQVSPNLPDSNWEDFLAITNTAHTIHLLDSSVTNLPSRYYRAVLEY